MAHYQLRQMHAIEYFIPRPYTAIFKDWRKDPFGGGWHFWNVDVRPWEVIKRMRRPSEDHHVYICGEAYSNNQGWVEGALSSAELLLEDEALAFKLRRPDWLPEDYDLGP
jgi:monoamine oxidase